MSRASAEHLISLIVHKVRLVIDLLEDISLKKFPSETPRILIDIIKNICLALKHHALTTGEDTGSLDDEDIENELKIILSLLLDITPHLRFVEGASVERTPWDLVQPFEDFSRRIYQKTPIILRPQWAYNFTIRPNLIRTYKACLESILSDDEHRVLFDKCPEEIYVISFPGIERKNILLQSILGHELGHPIASEYLGNEDQSSYLSEIRDEVDKHITETDPTKRSQELSDKVKLIQMIRNTGLNEIISDLVAIHLFGIAVFFAAYEIAIMMSMDDISGQGNYFYPPWRYRLREMHTELDWNSFEMKMKEVLSRNNEYETVYKIISERMTQLKRVTDEKEDVDRINKEDIKHIAYQSIQKALPRVRIFLNNKPSLSVDISVENIFLLNQRLMLNLPPNAIENISPFEPIIPSMPEIINAGWFNKLTYLPDKITTLNEDKHYDKLNILNSLIYKALELREIHLKYKEVFSKDK